MKIFKVNTKSAGQRADVFTAANLGHSRSSIERLFDMGEVSIGGKSIKTGYKLKIGDILQVDTKLLTTEPQPIKIPVLYEDVDVIVLNKPAGILTHSKGALNIEPTVASFIKAKITDSKLTGNRAGIIHRLDRQTSGVIICAKNEPSLKWLQKQFSTRKVVKEYLAVVEAIPRLEQAKINAPISRNPKRPNTFKVSSSGKPAQTVYKIKKTIKKNEAVHSLVELKPYTGRTHQIRVHMAYIGNPLIGDAIYGKNGHKMLLHAAALEIVTPNGKKMRFTAPTPDYFAAEIGGM